MKKKSIAIIGEGETEWFYLDSLRVARRYPFQMKPSFPLELYPEASPPVPKGWV